MISRRCPVCLTNWPARPPKDYAQCPECEVKTDPMFTAYPISPEEAKSRKNHAEFERYCEARDAQERGDLGESLSEPPEYSG